MESTLRHAPVENSPMLGFIPLPVRIVVLRIIIISSILSIFISIRYGMISPLFTFWDDQNIMGKVSMGFAIIPALVLLHHILRLWPRGRWSVRADLIYSTVELVFITGYVVLIARVASVIDRELLIICTPAFAIFWLSTIVSLFFTIWDLYVSKFRTIKSMYDFMENHNGAVMRWGESRAGRWSLFLGENILKKRFRIDQTFVRGLRAVVSMFCFLGMVVLGYLLLTNQPVEQDISLEVTEPLRLIFDADTRMVVSLAIGIAQDPEELLSPELIDLDITWRPESQYVPCHNVSEWPGLHVACDVQSPFDESSPDNLIITINYARALQRFPVQSLRTGVYLNFVTKEPGNDHIDDITDTFILPIQLYPGFHLFGTTFYSCREAYSNSRNLAFGLPFRKRHLIANVQALLPDPNYINSNSGEATATLRLTYQGGILASQSRYVVQKEQSNNSVIKSVSFLGGIWTVINGLFAAVFGCSVLLVVFGIKPLSVYGLVHLFQDKKSLVNSGHSLTAEQQKRTIEVLREHLLDSDLNGDEEPGEEEK